MTKHPINFEFRHGPTPTITVTYELRDESGAAVDRNYVSKPAGEWSEQELDEALGPVMDAWLDTANLRGDTIWDRSVMERIWNGLWTDAPAGGPAKTTVTVIGDRRKSDTFAIDWTALVNHDGGDE